MAREENDSPFRLTVDLNVLDHLADGLYSSVAAVLTETVANAWDADAENVHLDLDVEHDRILVRDDGIGMSVADVNDRYLRVGYRRRFEGETSPGKKRRVMGRKGIGKLSSFSISDLVRIETKKEGADVVALEIDVRELRKQMGKGAAEVYRPRPVAPRHAELLGDHGTVVELTSLKRSRLREIDPASLRRRLARRFSVVGGRDFRVFVAGTEVTSADRDDLKFVQYVWVFRGTDFHRPAGLSDDHVFELDGRADGWPENRVVRGWIGTVDRPKQLATPEGNLNSIVVLSRGRLVQEDILQKIAGAGLFTKYLTGQIEVDWLDDTEKEDIVTSDRQRLREDDERVTDLVAFLRGCVDHIGNRWTDLRRRDKTDELRSRYPKIDDWLNGLPQGWRRKAEKLLSSIALMEIGGDDDETSRKELMRHAVYGFERLRLRGDAEELDDALERGRVDVLLKLLADRDALEAALYRDIVRNRLKAIEELTKRMDDDEKERVLQKYLFDHLWLLDPSWDRATGDDAMEQRIRLLPDFEDDETTNERYGRIDIRYRTVTGRNVIVELKRTSARPSKGELLDQVEKYAKALKRLFPNDSFDFVIVLGKVEKGTETTLRSAIPGVRVITYDELVTRARQSYSEYLERTKKIDFIEKVFS